MRRRALAGLLLGALLLGVANLAAAWRRAKPRFVVGARDVERIEIRYVDWDTIQDPEPVVRQDRYRVISDREDIALVCEVLSSMFLRQFPMPENRWEQVTLHRVRGSRYVFHLNDGTTRTIEGVGGYIVYFDGHWCYASSGEAYGYVPILRLLNPVEQRAELVNTETTIP